MPELTVMPVANPPAKLSPREPTPEGASLAVTVVMFLAILIPLAGVMRMPSPLPSLGGTDQKHQP